MIDFRILRAEEYHQAISLADQTFRDNEHTSMGDAFPQVFSPALNQSYGAFIDGQLVSFIGLVPSIVHVGAAKIQAYSIGAVCTLLSHRNKGYASILLENVIAHVQKAKGSLLFVSGNLPIYEKAGCTVYGELKKYEIQNGELSPSNGYFVREVLPYDWFSLQALHQSKKVRVEQSLYDFAILHQSKGFASIQKMDHRILVSEIGNQMKGFVVIGVPKNESAARVIEWGGQPEAIKAILAKSFEFGINYLKISIPIYESELNRQLDSIENTISRFPGTIKITSLKLLLEQIEPFFNGKVKIVDIDRKYKELTFNGKTMIVDNEYLKQLLLIGDPDLDRTLKGIFPIPLPHPEGLNYV